MAQPPGFVDARYPDHVCRLKKALYGLRQAPRAWFVRFSDFLLSLGFHCSRSDTSLLFFRRGIIVLYLLLYVDDIIITGNNSSFLQRFIARIDREFVVKGLGRLSYFLGLEATHSFDGLFLSHTKYAHDILTPAELLESKAIATPLVSGESLVSTGTSFGDPTLALFVGAPLYLTITRPDLSYVVNHVSQFLHSPTVDHFAAVN